MEGPDLVGILNLTPDSFSGDGIYCDTPKALQKTQALFDDGATLVDIGAESTRPGGIPIPEDEEWRRLQPVLSDMIEQWPGNISLDSNKPQLVRRAAEQLGRFIVNDVTGFNNPAMIEVVAEFSLGCVVSHFPEEFGQDIQAAHQSTEKINDEDQVLNELLKRYHQLIDAGVDKDDIVLDPGIGFGKTYSLNWKLLEFASLVPDHKVMIGYSRKKFLGPQRKTAPPNLMACDIAVANRALYLRVHDVAGHALHLRSK